MIDIQGVSAGGDPDAALSCSPDSGLWAADSQAAVSTELACPAVRDRLPTRTAIQRPGCRLIGCPARPSRIYRKLLISRLDSGLVVGENPNCQSMLASLGVPVEWGCGEGRPPSAHSAHPPTSRLLLSRHVMAFPRLSLSGLRLPGKPGWLAAALQTEFSPGLPDLQKSPDQPWRAAWPPRRRAGRAATSISPTLAVRAFPSSHPSAARPLHHLVWLADPRYFQPCIVAAACNNHVPLRAVGQPPRPQRGIA